MEIMDLEWKMIFNGTKYIFVYLKKFSFIHMYIEKIYFNFNLLICA